MIYLKFDITDSVLTKDFMEVITSIAQSKHTHDDKGRIGLDDEGQEDLFKMLLTKNNIYMEEIETNTYILKSGVKESNYG